MTYTLTWFTTTGCECKGFNTFDDAEAFAKDTLLDANGIAGSVIPNHPALTPCDDKLFHGDNVFAGITCPRTA